MIIIINLRANNRLSTYEWRLTRIFVELSLSAVSFSTSNSSIIANETIKLINKNIRIIITNLSKSSQRFSSDGQVDSTRIRYELVILN